MAGPLTNGCSAKAVSFDWLDASWKRQTSLSFRPRHAKSSKKHGRPELGGPVIMETLLSQAEQLPGLLAASRSGLVRNWDPATLTRALSWGRFFRRLHGRLRAQPGLRAALERRLNRAGLLGVGHWRRCPELLALALLENRALPSAARHRFLRGLLAPAGGPKEEEEPFVHLLARRKAASQLLLLHLPPLAMTEEESDDAGGRDGPVAKTQAQLLLSRLREESHGEGGHDDVSPSAALLAQLPSGPTLYRAVAAALLEPSREVEARATLLPWLLGDQARLASFCRLLPAPRMALLCRRHPELSSPYLKLLASWGRHLVYDPLRGEWRTSGSEEEGQVPWHELRERVRCLWQDPGPPGSAIRTQLKQLKAQEGDFDVPGLSIWSDLLLDMETSASSAKETKCTPPPPGS
ncbi:Fanconi anemia group F protein [Pogona vitticeps]